MNGHPAHPSGVSVIFAGIHETMNQGLLSPYSMTWWSQEKNMKMQSRFNRNECSLKTDSRKQIEMKHGRISS